MADSRPLGLVRRAAALRARYRLPLVAGLGALAGLGQAPWGLWPLTIAALAAIYALFTVTVTVTVRGGWRRAAVLGWAAGTGYFALSLSWIVEPFLVDVARHGWMAPFALIGLSGGLALFWAAGFALARITGAHALGFVAALTLSEAARTYLLTGFPWAQTGHALIDTAWLGWAALGGALMLSAFAVAGAAALWHLLAGPRLPAAATLLALAALYAGGAALTPLPHTPPDAPVVRLIQPNAPQHQKWDPAHVQTFFDRQIAFTADGADRPRPDLIVWPETAVPTLLHRAQPSFDTISRAAGPVPVVLGLQRTDGLRYYNSLVVLDEAGKPTAVYDKHHLVPFGEYIPFGNQLQHFGIGAFAAQQGHGYSAGPGAQVIRLGDLGQALPLICYEGVFPQDLRAAPARPDMLLLITNDAWFGQVSGPYQHLAQARLRSVEQGLPMIRVANTGISAMIDPAGRVIASLPLGQAGWRDVPLPAPLSPTVYARTGDWPVILLALLTLSVCFVRNRRAVPIR